MTTHTQGKLSLGNVTFGDFSTTSDFLLNSYGQSIAIATSQSKPETVEAHSNARRLVACWNVCEGLDTDYIEYAARTNNFVGAVQWLTAERDQANKERDDLQREVNGKNAAIQRAHDRWFDAAAERDKALAINAELLAALVTAEAEIAQVQERESYVFGDEPDVLEKVRAAIAKAKGGAA